MKTTILALLFQLVLSMVVAQTKIDLSGKWNIELSSGQKGLINLPGTTDEAKLGTQTVGSDFGILTRAYKFIGKAWYEREFEIPADWDGMQVELTLERVLWESTVFIDGKKVGNFDALNSKHVYNLGELAVGKHQLRICIDNDMIHNIGDKGHPYSEYTQSIWNGIVGKIELKKIDKLAFSNPTITTAVYPQKLTFIDSIQNRGKRKKYTMRSELRARNSDILLWSKEEEIVVESGQSVYEYTAEMPKSVDVWNDITPHLYDFKVSISNKNKEYDNYQFELGFREIKQGKHKILLNGKPVMLRGNLDCVHFPLTGYPSCDTEEWERIFKIYKSYGLNHVRYHSWCPPQAAFIAADRVGIYIQSETIWIDWWMSGPNPRKEMDTKGHPQGLGKNPSADAFVQKEMRRMVNRYGNHASFVMMCIGNELGNSDFDVMQSWLEPYKEQDSRRLYSVSAARKVMPVDQYMVTHYLPNIGGTRGILTASTDWDYENVYSKSPVPTIAHEIGQWPVYPRWDEIKKYTGVLKARNFEGFYKIAKENAVENQNESFVQGSGYLNQLMYKHELESFLRTPSCAGIQLLSMQDYQGQGEALIGWLDVFYDSKGITTPEKFRLHCDTSVALLRTKKFIWNNSDTLKGEIQIAHYGLSDIKDQLYWKLVDNKGSVFASGITPTIDIASGTSKIYTQFSTTLSQFTEAKQLNLELGFMDRPIKNSWKIWVYPSVEPKRRAVYVCESYDEKCKELLKKGEKVLLLANHLGTAESVNPISFTPLYWSFTFFPGQRCNTIGMLVDDAHPAFESFPTGKYSDWQWASIYNNAQGFIFNKAPKDFEFIAQPIDDFHRNNRLGGIFETKVGKGTLLVSGFNLNSNNVGKNLYQSILDYMNSPQFSPTQELSSEYLDFLFKEAEPVSCVAPAPFEGALIYIDCAAGMKRHGADSWKKAFDIVQLLRGSTYQVEKAGIWKDDVSAAWHGKDLTIELSIPPGVIGDVHLFVHDWNSNGRDGMVTLEGRELEIGKHDGEGKWIKIHVMREDSNDGKINIRVKANKGPNIMISKLVFIEK